MGAYIDSATALESLAITILEIAKESVPVDTGSLRESGRVDRYGDGFRISFGAGYRVGSIKGGGEYHSLINYATYVHENEDASHLTGKAKYLEEPARALVAEANAKGYNIEITFEAGVTINANPGCVAAYITENSNKEEQKMPGVKINDTEEEISGQNIYKSQISARYDTVSSFLDYAEILLGRSVPYPIRLLKRLVMLDNGTGRLPGIMTRNQPKVISLAKKVVKNM